MSPAVDMPSADLDRAALVAWGEQLGDSLVAPAVLTLSGDLGAGKTTLVQAICRGYGVEEPVTSPTFALVHRYAAVRSPVYHLDLYRLKGAQDLANIGWDDLLDERAIVLVEWPDRAEGALPEDARAIRLEHVERDPDLRRVTG
jgi:tRNA threonylcarbamoyl adenosine modification protein YjeE